VSPDYPRILLAARNGEMMRWYLAEGLRAVGQFSK